MSFENIMNAWRRVDDAVMRDVLGLSFCFLWFVVASHVLLVESWTCFWHSAEFAFVCVLMFVVLAVGGALFPRQPSMRLVCACALACVVCAVMFQLVANTQLIFVLATVQLVCAVIVFFAWGKALITSSANRMLLLVMGALFLAELAHLLFLAIVYALNLGFNKGFLARLELLLCGVLPLISCFILARKVHYAGVRKASRQSASANDQVSGDGQVVRDELAPGGERVLRDEQDLRGEEALRSEQATTSAQAPKSADKSQVHFLWLQFAILAIGLVVTSFVGGLIFRSDLASFYYLESWRALAGAVVLLIFLLVVAGASSELAAQKRANACSIAALVLTIAGISLFSSGKVAFGVAETIISTAHICLVALAAYVMCCIVQKTKNKRAHTALFSLAFLVSGMFSIYYIGVMVKRILGYDLEILGPLAIVALSAMVVIYVIVNGVGHSFMQRNLEKENANLLKHQHELIAANAELSVRAEMQGATEETSASAEAADWKISAADVLQGLGLTRRETDVMLLMCEAWSDTMIANELGISRSTVRFHINNAYKKTACHSRVEFLALLRGQTSVSLPAAIIGEMSASC